MTDENYAQEYIEYSYFCNMDMHLVYFCSLEKLFVIFQIKHSYWRFNM